MPRSYEHYSVLSEEVIHYLNPQPGQNFIDATLGGGGHSQAILNKNKPGQVLAFEIDPHAVVAASQKLAPYKDRIIIVDRSYVHLKEEYQKHLKLLAPLSGIVIDLGLSSDQLDQANRGFSFRDLGPLDMRFDPKQTLTASDIILNWSPSELEVIFRKYGELPNAKKLSRGLIAWRQDMALDKQKQKLIDTSVFVSTILRILNIKTSSLARFKRHPATLVFQALRMAVNHELENLQSFLPQALEILSPGGRLVVISFHSLEDRIVKDFFREQAQTCICPPQNPICVCKQKPKLKIITKRPITASESELKNNNRSRSAKMRVAQKLAPQSDK